MTETELKEKTIISMVDPGRKYDDDASDLSTRVTWLIIHVHRS